jgi:hypothetical protein
LQIRKLPWCFRRVNCLKSRIFGNFPTERRLRSRQVVGWARNEKPSKGFAHRFRPTYAGANMGHPYGAVKSARGLRGRPAVSHICQNHADMGHPAFFAEIEPKPIARRNPGLKSDGPPTNSRAFGVCIRPPGDCGEDRAQKRVQNLPAARPAPLSLPCPPRRSDGSRAPGT